MAPTLTTTEAQEQSPRRREILLAAIDLFHQRGYHATGMNDIGEAIGLTGPAIYRHFSSKEDILETALLNAARYMERRVAPVVEACMPPLETLEQLVRDLTHVVLTYPAVVSITRSERRHMSDRAIAIYDRSVGLRETEWVGPLVRLRPEIGDTEARMRIRAAQSMLAAGATIGGSMARERRERILHAAAMRVLLERATRPIPAPIERDAADVGDVA